MLNVTTESRVRVKSGISTETDPHKAVEELARLIVQDKASVYLVFASSKYDLGSLEQALGSYFPESTIGCTTSGEIGPQGYSEHSLVGLSIASDELTVFSSIIEPLSEINASKITISCATMRAVMRAARSDNPKTAHFAMLLIDGLSAREEQVVANVYQSLGQIPLIGGSAGDDMAFKKSHVYWEGKFHSDAAIVSVFSTTLPFTTFKTQHFVPSGDKLVITGADPDRRIVTEINGRPAAPEYARILKFDTNELKPMIFSSYPLMLRIGGEYYVRSIQKVNEDNSLTFFCAIDEGLVLTLGRGVDMIADLRETLKRESAKLFRPQVTITCECILRRLEVLDRNLVTDMNSLVKQNHLIGFHTYGEQFNPIHINQTFAGVMLGG